MPTLPPPSLTCTSAQDGLCGGAPGAGAGVVASPERAMGHTKEVAGKERPAGVALSLRPALATAPFIYLPLWPRLPRDGWGRGGGAESLWGAGWWLSPPPLLRPRLGTPYWLGFSPKKGRKEAAGRPCPAPRTWGWGDREAREGHGRGPRGQNTRQSCWGSQSPWAAIGPYSRWSPLQDSHSLPHQAPQASRTGVGAQGLAPLRGPGVASCPICLGAVPYRHCQDQLHCSCSLPSLVWPGAESPLTRTLQHLEGRGPAYQLCPQPHLPHPSWDRGE